MNTRTRTCMAGLVGLLGMLMGCSSTQSNGSLSQAVTDYNAQRFDKAHEAASNTARRAAPGTEREDAAYVAGLSAYQLGQIDEAERQFLAASASVNLATAARAKAMLGQVRLDQQRPRDAAVQFNDAYPMLQGDDAQKCAYQAAVANQQVGDMSAARKWLALSIKPVPVTNASGSPSGFALQVGVFRDKKRAQRAMAEVDKLAERHGLGEARVVPRRDEFGKWMYVVQFGSFATRESAAAARAKIGKLEYIVATAAGAHGT